MIGRIDTSIRDWSRPWMKRRKQETAFVEEYSFLLTPSVTEVQLTLTRVQVIHYLIIYRMTVDNCFGDKGAHKNH
jgi:hypothetical protein